MKTRLGLILVLGAAVIGTAGIAIGLFLWYVARTEQPTARQVASLPTVVRQIQQLNELVSVKYTIQKVVGVEEKKVPFSSERLLLMVHAKVLAGVPLSEITAEDVSSNLQGQLLVRLPQARILHAFLDEQQTQVWDRRVTWWTPWVPFSPDLESRARLAALEDIRKSAVEMGILKEARQNAETSVRKLLETLGVLAVTYGNPS